MNHNYLKATIINTFLESLNNPAVTPKGFHDVYLDIDLNQSQDETVRRSIQELGFAWSEAYVEDILNRYNRTTIISAQDVLDADAAGIDILVFKPYTEIKVEKAKKGTAEYDEWLRKYREKRGIKQIEDAIKDKKINPNTLKARKALAGISTVTASSIKDVLDKMKFGVTSTKINGVKVSIHADEERTMFQVHSDYSGASHTAMTIMLPFNKITKKDMGDCAVAINKIVNDYADYYLPKQPAKEVD